MATDQRNLPTAFSVDADFQAWVQGVHNQIIAVGMIQTSDTGQINPATVTKPASTNTSQGYEIWRFNDALQSTLPIYFKIEYGSSATTSMPSMWLTVGTGSNGSGTLTGQVGARKQIYSLSSRVAGLDPSYCSSDGSGLALITEYEPLNVTWALVFVIDRTRDGAGNATADGIIVFNSSSAGQIFFQVIPILSSIPAGVNSSSLSMSPYLSMDAVGPVAPTIVAGVNIPVIPFMVLCGKLMFSKMMHIARDSLISTQVSISVNTLGGTHTYMPLAQINFRPTTTTTSDDICILWE